MARRRSGPDPDDETDAAGGPAHLPGLRLAAGVVLPALSREGRRREGRPGDESREDGRRPEGQSGAVAEATEGLGLLVRRAAYAMMICP
jgi:hypothetical protein